MEIRALIVDDEQDSRSVLKSLLRKFCPHVTIEAEAANVNTAYELVMQYEPDVVFLDIQMPGGNGFNLLKKFAEIPFDVIFVTSYDKYAIDAIRLSALHYLMKPIEVEDLKEAVKRLEKNMLAKCDKQLMIENAINNLENIEKKIPVHIRGKVILLSLNDISHLEGQGNYTVIYTNKHEHYTSSKNLGEYEKSLEHQRQFTRISKSCIVNVNYITEYSKGEPCHITLSGKYTLEVSRRKKQELLELLKSRS